MGMGQGKRSMGGSLAVGSQWAIPALLAGLLSVAVVLPGRSDARPARAAGKAASPARAAAPAPLLQPAHVAPGFEANRGQADARVRFLSRGHGRALFLTEQEAVLVFGAKAGREPAALRIRARGASRPASVQGVEPLPVRAHYFTGASREEWRTSVPSFARVRYAALYPGIDLVYYSQEGQLEFDFIVAPGADPALPELNFAGAQRIAIQPNGDLRLTLPGGHLLLHAPVIYQPRGAERIAVSGGYQMREGGGVGFRIGAYDPALPLVIDPVLALASYLGGSAADRATGVALDAAGNVYVVGETLSLDFPSAAAAPRGGTDVFVARLAAGGAALLSTTYLGGSAEETAAGIAIAADGSIVLAGSTRSPDFPLHLPLQAACRGDAPGQCSEDAFVTRLSADGSALLFSTYFGGSGDDAARALAVDADGNIHFAGRTRSTDFTALHALQPAAGQADAFAAAITPAGALLYATPLGGAGDDEAAAVAVTPAGEVWFAGATASADFPVRNALQSQCALDASGACSGDAFAARLSFAPAGAPQLAFATFLGGSGADAATAIALDAAGNVLLSGVTASADFPLAAALQAQPGGQRDAFVSRLSADGAALLSSTYLGGSGDDAGRAVAADAFGNIYVAGDTNSADFPLAAASQPQCAADSSGACSTDAFLAVLHPAAPQLHFATYLGGSGADSAAALALDAGSGAVYLAGVSASPDLPVAQAVQPVHGGDADAFLAQFASVLPASHARAAGDSMSPAITACSGTAEWTGGAANGQWGTAGNWSMGVVPGALDDVCIPPAFAGQTITIGALAAGNQSINSLISNANITFTAGPLLIFNPSTMDANLTVSGGTLTFSSGGAVVGNTTLSGGTLTFNGIGTFSGAFTQTGGTLAGISPVSIAGLFTWSGGVQDGGVTNANGGLLLNGSTHTLRTRTLNTPAPVTWTAGRFDHGQGAVINNTATWDLQSDDNFLFTQGGVRGTFNNNGTFTKSAGSGVSTADLTFRNLAGGTVNVSSGTLNFSSACVSSGAFNVGSGAILDFSAGTHDWNAGTTFDGTGLVDVGATINVNATIPVGAPLTQTGGSMNGVGTLEFNALFTWAAGVQEGGGVTNVNGGMALTTTTRTLRNRTLNTPTPVTWTAGRFDHGQGAVINNTATWDLQSDDDFLFTQGGVRGTFNNNGTFTKSAGSGLSTSDLDFRLPAGGVFNVNAGTYQFNFGVTSNGAFNVAATLDFNSGTHNLNSGTAFNGGGTVLVSSSVLFNVTVTVAPALQLLSGGTFGGSGTLTVNGLFTWAGGVQEGGGVTNVNGGMALTTTTRTLRNRTLNTPTPVTWTGGRFDHGQGAVINNTATWDLQSDDDFLFTQGGVRGTFNNNGTFTKSAGSGLSTFDMNLVHSAAAVINVLTGTLQFNADSASSGDYNVTGALDLNSGTHSFNSGATVTGSGSLVLGATVSFNAGSVTSTTAPILLNGGTTTFQTGGAVAMSALTQTAGTLQGPDTINIAGVFNWSGGTQNGPGVTNANGGFNLTGGVNLNNGRTLNNAATGVISGSGFYNGGNGAVFNNLPGATLDLQNDLRIGSFLGGTDTVNNQGTLTRSTATGTFTIFAVFNNSGTVHVNTGTLMLSNHSTTTGSITVTGTLHLSAGTHDFNSGATVTGSGSLVLSTTINFNAGSVTSTTAPILLNGGTTTFQTGGAVAMSALTQTAGTLQGPDTINIAGVFNWSGGTQNGPGVTNANGGFNLTGGVNLNNGRTLNNAATGVISGSGFYNGGNGAVFNNLPGATLDLQNDLRIGSFLGGTDTVNNQGTLTRSTATGTFTIFAVFNNSGTVHVNTGTLSLNNGGNCGSVCSGDYSVTGRLIFNGGTFELGSGADISGSGIVEFGGGTTNHPGTLNVSGGTRATGGTGNLSGTVTSVGAITVTGGTLTLSKSGPPGPLATPSLTQTGGTLQGADTIDIAGVFNWSGGTQNGPGVTNANGGFNLTGGVNLNNGRTLNNAATGVISGSGFYNGGNGAVFNNLPGATLDLQNDLRIGSFLGGTDTVNNQGTLTRSTATGTFTIFSTSLNNSGTIEIRSGDLRLAQGAPQFTQTAGVTRLNGGSLNASATMTFAGGVLEGNLPGSITGNISNTGAVISPGLSPGTLSQSSGNYTQGPGGTFRVEIGGLTPGAQHDVLATAGTATLGGTLEVILTGGFTPVAGNSFTILTAQTRTGTFATANLPALSGGLVWNVVYTANSVQLQVQVAVVCTINFDNSSASGLWQDAANWDTNTLPSSNDRACIPAGFNVTLSAGAHTVDQFQSDSPLTLSGGSLTLTGASGGSFANAAFNLNGGTLDGPGALTIAGPFGWGGGTQQGTGSTTSLGGATVSNVVTLRSRTVIFGSQSALTGTINHGQGAVIQVPAGATFNLQGTGSSLNFTEGGASSTLNVAGTMNKTGSGASQVQLNVNNIGAIANSSTARIAFAAAYTQTGAGSLLRLDGGEVSASLFAIQGGRVEGFNSPFTGMGIIGDVLNTGGLLAPGFSGQVGALGITGNYTQGPGGTLEIEAFGASGGQFDALSISNAASLGGTLNVQSLFGFTPVSGASFTPLTYASRTGDFAAANNLIAPGLNMLTLPGGASYRLTFVAAGACTINFDNSSGNGLWQDPTNWDTNNVPGPAADVCIGIAIPGPFAVTKSGAGGDSVNSLTIADGQGMFSLSSNLNLANASAIGDGGFSQSGGALTGSGVLDINGPFFWSGGTQDGAGQTNANGNLVISGTALKVLGQRVLTSNFAGSISGPGQLQVGNSFVNQAGFDFLDDSDITLGAPGAQLTNSGFITKSGGAGNSSIQTAVQNFGTIAAQSGTLTVSGVPLLNQGGLIDVQTGNLTVTQLTQLGGALQVSGPGLLTFSNPFDLQGGLFYGTVNFTANGSVINTGGVVYPGAGPGSITLTGDYTQGPGGSLVVELGGVGAGQFDVLHVGGAAALDGALAVVSFGGFTPLTGHSFSIMTYSSVTGDFAFKSGLNISSPPMTATPQATSYILQVPAAGTTDLSLAKTDAPDPVSVGANLTYTLTITNNGPGAASNVVLTDTLPANALFVSAVSTQGACSHAAGAVTCAIGSMNNAAVVTVTIVVRATSGPTLVNNASVTATETDPAPANNSASTITAVSNTVFFGPIPYLCQNDSPFFAGIQAGTVALENFEDGLFNQPGVTASAGSVIGPGGGVDSVDCDDGVIDGSGSNGRSLFSGSGSAGIRFTFNAAILGGLPTQAGIVWTDGAGTITFEAFDALGVSLGVVTGNHADGSTDGTTGEDRFYGISHPGGISAIFIHNSSGGIEVDHLQYGPVAAPTVNLTLTKADTPDPVNVGGALTYTLTVTNNGSTPATVVTLTDPLPSSVAFNSSSTTQGSCAQSSGTVTCSLGTLNASASATVTITVIPGPGAAPAVTNTATVSSAEADANPADNSASATTTVTATTVDLALTKSDAPDPATVGGALTYTLTVTNNGPSTATSVVLSDPLPAALSFSSFTASQGACTHSAGTVTCPLGTLVNGASATVTITATVGAAAVPSVTNTASVTSAESDSNTANNSASATTTVIGPTADVSVTKLDTPDPVIVGALLTYSITVSNAGPDPATTVTLTDVLPASLTFQSFATSQGSCSRAGNTVTCTLGTIASGANATVTITGTPGPAAVPSVTNTTSVTTTASDPVPANNSASATTTVNPSADLSLTKIDTPDPVGTNSTLVYTVTVFNAGPSPATGVVLTDTLPAGVTFVSASPSCVAVALVVTCNLGTVASGASSPVTISVTTGGVTTLTNSASVTANEPDPNLANNSASENTTVVTGPVISLSTMSLVFASQPVGTTSPPQAFSVTNSGNAAVSISGIVATGNFTQTNTCGASLAAGATCFVAITFTPSGTGTLFGDVSITHAAPGSPHVVQLSGAGVLAPAISLTSLSVVFGTQLIQTTSPSQTVTLTNTGSAPLNISSITASAEFAQTNTCGSSVAVGASCTITITFTPVATGIRTGAITITSNAPGSPPVITLTGVGASPNVSISTSLLVFAAQPVGTTSPAQSVTLSNSGASALAISSITLTGDFAQSNTCGASLAAGSSCVITVTFTPTLAGPASGVLTITDNGSGSPRVVGLSGAGVTASLSLSPSSLTFSAQPTGTTSGAQAATVTNSGGVAVAINSITVTGNFSVTHNCPASLGIGASCTVNVRFAPLATGPLAGTVNIANSTPASPAVINLLGTGVTSSPALALSATQLGFPQTIAGNTSAAQTVTLTNTGNVTLNFTSITLTGDFTLTPAATCGLALAPGASCEIHVTFAPSAAGLLGGSLTITSDAPGSPHVVSLSGAGVAPGPAVGLSAVQVSFGAVAQGRSSAPQMVTLSNTGNATLTIVSIVASGDFTATNTCGGTLNAGANCTITITFTPSASGLRAGAITITHNAAGSPHSIALSGSGTSFSLTALAGSPTSMTISAGQAASFSVSLIPTGGFNEQVTITCTGTPPLSTCTASPNNFNLSASVTVNVVVATTAARAFAPPVPWRTPWPAAPPPLAAWLFMLSAAMALACAARAGRRRRLLPATAALLFAGFLTSCAGGHAVPPPVGGGGTPAGAYPITVTATSASGLASSISLSVTVQ
jgi:uncharacterized repeat protein (TIGR01451 family)